MDSYIRASFGERKRNDAANAASGPCHESGPVGWVQAALPHVAAHMRHELLTG